jgi:hypothetical protein
VDCENETPFDRLARGQRIVEEDARGLPGAVLEAAGREALTEALGGDAMKPWIKVQDDEPVDAKDRRSKAVALIDGWLTDPTDYDEKAWPVISRALQCECRPAPWWRRAWEWMKQTARGGRNG